MMSVSCPPLLLKTKNKENFRRWSLKVILWNFVQPLCCLLRNFITAYVVWKQRCGRLCATSRVALGFLWALRQTQNYRLLSIWALVLVMDLETEGEGWSGTWESFSKANREREREKGPCFYDYVAGRLNKLRTAIFLVSWQKPVFSGRDSSYREKNRDERQMGQADLRLAPPLDLPM